jgi:aminoglycoside phosphotransferase (APT) family kinase protein
MATIDTAKLTTLFNHIAPDHTIQTIEALHLGFTNRSYRITVIRPDSTHEVFVVKNYSENHGHVFGQDATTRASLEHNILTFLCSNGIPCPEPGFVDLQGTILGSPVLITKHLPGAQIMAHPANPLWAEQASTIAKLLARIHMLPCPDSLTAILPNATTLATLFLQHGTVPDYMQAYPGGVSIWQIIHQELPKLQTTDPVLVHGDYWSGNFLWEQSRVTGILDWENGAYGEPGFDLANCRMEMIIDGMDDAAATFLRTYESITGKTVRNLGLCELAVAAQPMWQRAPFLSTAPYQERFRRFVANAKERA